MDYVLDVGKLGLIFLLGYNEAELDWTPVILSQLNLLLRVIKDEVREIVTLFFAL